MTWYERPKVSPADNSVTRDGTTENGEIAVWTGDGQVEGDSNLMWDGTQLVINDEMVRRRYGEIRVEGNSTATTVSSSSSDFSNAVQVGVFDTNGISQDTTPDHTNDHITIDVADIYTIIACVSFSGAASADTFSMALFKNNSTAQLGARVTRKLGSGGDVGACSVMTIASLAVNDTIELWIQNESNTNNPTIEDASLVVFT